MPQMRLISGAVAPVELSILLHRLSPEERATVVERRIGPNAGRLDTPALADRLARPDSINAALAEVNAGQLLLLRWLAEQLRLRVSWSELNDALGDRLASDLRDYYLRDLRLWALADFSPDPKKGFFATYPGVVASLPTGKEIRLRPRLDMMTSDLLLKACTALGLKSPPTRKDGRIDLLMATLTDPPRCRAVADGLSRPAREFFDWVREQGGWVGAAEMRARAPDRNPYGGGYYGVESFWHPPRGKGDVDPLAEL